MQLEKAEEDLPAAPVRKLTATLPESEPSVPHAAHTETPLGAPHGDAQASLRALCSYRGGN